MNISFELADLLSGAGAGLLIGAIIGLVSAFFLALGGIMDGPEPSFVLPWSCVGISVLLGAVFGALGWAWWVVVLAIAGIAVGLVLLIAAYQLIRG